MILVWTKEKRVTQADIARELDISVVSVSNALSGKQGISDELRQKILDAAEELGYQGSVRAANERRTPRRLGVLIAKRYLLYTPSMYMKLYQEMVLETTKRGCIMMLEVLDAGMEERREAPEMIFGSRVDGVLVVGELSRTYTRVLRERSRVPVIFVDYYVDLPDTDFIVSDSYNGACTLTRKLLAAGMREIGFVGAPRTTSSITDRYLGYRKAMMEQKLEIRPEWVIPDRTLPEGELRVKLPEKLPQAFVCNCDRTAALVVAQLRARGLRVPEDIGVVGFDHYLPEGIDGLELTTFEVDLEAMAKVSVRTLLRKIDHVHFIPRLRVITGKFIEGTSAGGAAK